MNSFFEGLQGFFEERVFSESRIGSEDRTRFFTRDLNQLYIREMLHSDIGEAGLPRPEEGTGTAELQINLCEHEPGIVLLHCFESRGRRLLLRGREEETVALLITPANAAAELVELREAESLGTFDHDDRAVRDIDADFYDGG